MDPTAATRPLDACVAVATRRRARMLEALLASFHTLSVPSGTTLTFLVVENDSEARARDLCDRLAEGLPGRLIYVLEPEMGIPMARNRALREADAIGADILLFVDDDELVTADWLTEFIAAYRSSGAMLIGGPVLPVRPEEPLNTLQNIVFNGLEAKHLRRARRAERKTGTVAGRPRAVFTCNWLCDLRLHRDLGLEFDESLRFDGGEDTAFYREVRQRGAKIGWAEKARVHETQPVERLSPGYLFRRSKSQSTTAFRQKLNDSRLGNAASSILVSTPLKIAELMLLFLSLPVSRAYGFVTMIETAGWIVGRWTGLLGGRSRMYVRTTGG